MVPEGWRELPLSSVLDKIIDYRGKAPPKTEHGVRLITARNVRFGFVSLEHEEYIDEGLFSEWMNRGLPKKDDILFTTEAPLGNVAMFPDGGPYALGQRIVTLRAGPKASSEFLFQFLISEIGQDRVFQKASGSTALGIKSRELQKVFILLPPLAEQKRIAEILGVWDRAIAVAGQQLDLARTQKRALMQTLLTPTRRFPGFDGRPWKEVRLGDVGKCIRGVSYKPDQVQTVVSDDTVMLYRSTNIQGGEIVEEPIVMVPRSIVTEERLLRKGDLAVCMSNGSKALVGKSAPIRHMDDLRTVGAFCAIFRPHKGENQDFVRFLFESSRYDEYITITLAGSSINNLKNSDIEDMRFRMPQSKDEVYSIAALLGDADTEIKKLAEQITRLQAEKKALMQQLLTGKKRLAV